MSELNKAMLSLLVLSLIVYFSVISSNRSTKPVIEPPPIPTGVNKVRCDSDLAGKYREVIFECDSLLVVHDYRLYYPSREKLTLVTASTHASGMHENVEFKWSIDSTFIFFHELGKNRRGICYERDSVIICTSIFGENCMLAKEYDLYFQKMISKYEMLLPETLDVRERAKYYLKW